MEVTEQKSIFGNNQVEVTEKAAARMGELYQMLRDRLLQQGQFDQPGFSNCKFGQLGCITGDSRMGIVEHKINQMLPRLKQQIPCERLDVLKESLSSASLLTNALVGLIDKMQDGVK
jgi:hypothetical protein